MQCFLLSNYKESSLGAKYKASFLVLEYIINSLVAIASFTTLVMLQHEQKINARIIKYSFVIQTIGFTILSFKSLRLKKEWK